MVTKSLKRLVIYYIFVFLAWASFRLFIRLPEVVSELWFKPVIWLVPLFWWQISEGRERVKLFGGRLGEALAWGLLVGLFYYVVVKLVMKTAWWTASLDGIGIGLAAAVVEEVTFSGIILPRMIRALGRPDLSLILVAMMFATMRLPINLFVFHLDLRSLMGAFILAFLVAVVNGFIRLRSNNTLAAITAHFFYLVAVL